MVEDRIKELEDRLNRFENKVKLNFFEMQKLISEPKSENTAEERILEMEDLILLLQLEVTKLKEKVGQELDLELTPKTTLDVEERLKVLEEEVSSLKVVEPSIEQKIEKRPILEEIQSLRSDVVKDEVNKLPDKKEDDDTIEVNESIILEVQKILAK